MFLTTYIFGKHTLFRICITGMKIDSYLFYKRIEVDKIDVIGKNFKVNCSIQISGIFFNPNYIGGIIRYNRIILNKIMLRQ